MVGSSAARMNAMTRLTVSMPNPLCSVSRIVKSQPACLRM